MDKLREENNLIDLFCTLVKIPSPSLREEKIVNKIIEIFQLNNIPAKKDKAGNVIAKIEATDKSKKPILLSAHMDVVGDDSPVNIQLNGDIIETDKKRTLGADDKAGVAAAILLALELSQNSDIKHGGLEIVFTRDEEQTMYGIHNFNFDEIESEHVLVLDADKLGQVLIAGASYTKLTVEVQALKGGHSGIDIDDKTRLNAAKLIAELVDKIPQGTYKKDEYGVVTSINLGVIIGGGIDTALNDIKSTNPESGKYLDFMLDKAVTNVINTKAGAAYSIRSSNRKFEQDLINDIKNIIIKFNEKYDSLAFAQMTISEHLPPFEKSNDETVINAAKLAGEKLNIPLEISSFHAGAETHIYANNKNKYGKYFKPVLVGVANIFNMHSANEQIDYKSYLKGYNLLKEIFIAFNMCL